MLERREETLRKREEALQRREEAVKLREQQLEERARLLDTRDKRMATREKLAEEKLTRLEQYFATWIIYRRRLHCFASLQEIANNQWS